MTVPDAAPSPAAPAGADRPGAAGRTALTPAAGLLGATALHLGFQAVVTAVVYPALTEVPPERFAAAHAVHSRRIASVVAPVYGLVGAACVRALRTGPRSTPVLAAVAGSAGAGLATALVAAPTHRLLGRQGATPALVTRLRRADRLRLAGAVLAAGSALGAVLSAPPPRGPRPR